MASHETEDSAPPTPVDDDVAVPPLPRRPTPHAAGLAAAAVPIATDNTPPAGLHPSTSSGSNVSSALRPVTPEPADEVQDDPDPAIRAMPQAPRAPWSRSPKSSPRSIPGAGAGRGPVMGVGFSGRRQGVVFNDALVESLDSHPSSPPLSSPPLKAQSFRPRTHTMDGFFRQPPPIAADGRSRVGSFSSSGSLPMNEDTRAPPLQPSSDSFSYSSSSASRDRYSELQAATPTSSSKAKKKGVSRSRLMKRTSSRPTSPSIAPPPSVDSLPLPVPTRNANEAIMLMRNLCGRMRGDVELRADANRPWLVGTCYIQQEKGSLVFGCSSTDPFYNIVFPDLRGCLVMPIELADTGAWCLEISSLQLGISVLLRPVVVEDFDLWLAALLCWQQLRPSKVKLTNGRSSSGPEHRRTSEANIRHPSPSTRDPIVIKVGKLMLWDKGLAASPQAIVKRPSTRDLRSSQTSWRRVSCILQDDGEFKLLTENDATVVSIIQLSQLARHAVQRLDRSVLGEDHCIAIFPVYSPTATHLSVYRPVYIALETRVLFEVWFVILRAFTSPDVYQINHSSGEQTDEATSPPDDAATGPSGETTDQLFRVERKLTVRITEAKIRKPITSPELMPRDRHSKKAARDGTVGSYLAEVMLDGEVRARTTTKHDTKNPFWREECEFTDLPPTLPAISVVLKRVNGDPGALAHTHQPPLGQLKPGNYDEVACGSVDIPLRQTDRGRGGERWLSLYDDKLQPIGTMLVRVQYEELIILLLREYQHMSELLHKFSNGLTAHIAHNLPGNLRRVAELLLNIFQVSGSAIEWLMNLVEDEIDGIGNQATLNKPRFSRRLRSSESHDSIGDREQLVRDLGKSLAGEANLLFRGNSLLTQALEFHIRRLGEEFLAGILSDKIKEMNELNPNCEVDPSKLQQGEDLHQHWSLLLTFTNEVWGCISSSADRVPPELRRILKYIRAVAEDRFGDFLRTVSYTSVSGFLFLRFICPAILNPKLFGLLRDHPRPGAQRTLTLIAKGLQALANLSTIGKKETWMDPMNRFLNLQRQSLKDFLDSVCAIPMERTDAVSPASYSTPYAILNRLSPLAREGFPSLPYLIDQARSFAALVKLWVDDNPISSNPSYAYDATLLEFHSLCVDTQRRADGYHTWMEGPRLGEAAGQPQLTEMDNLSLADTAERAASPGADATRNISAYSGLSASARMEREGRRGTRPPGSSGSDIDASLELLSGSSSRGVTFVPEATSARSGPGQHEATASDQSGSGGSGGSGTMRGLRNGKQARKFLSGFIRKSRTASPDALMAFSMAAALERDKDHHVKEREGGRSRTSVEREGEG